MASLALIGRTRTSLVIGPVMVAQPGRVPNLVEVVLAGGRGGVAGWRVAKRRRAP